MKGGCAVIPGSYDPVTLGHLDIIRRSSGLFERVIAVVMTNSEKRYMFDADMRLDMLREAVNGLANVEVIAFDGLTVELCKANAPSVVVKGVRTASDFDYEAMIAEALRSSGGVETLLMPCDPQYARLSSTVVREHIKHGADISKWAPQSVSGRLKYWEVENNGR